MKLTISLFLAKFACFNLAVKLSDVALIKFWFSTALRAVKQLS